MALEKWLIDGPKVIELGAVRNLKVALIRGQVDIVGHDEPTARVEVHSVSGKDLRVTIDGDTLEIDHPQLRWDNFIDVFRSFSGSARADVSILVPHDVALKFGVVSSRALISEIDGDSSISTVSGDVVIDGCSGNISLNAVSGEVSVRNHTGRISARTVSGDITATGAVSKFGSDGVSGDVFLDLSGTPNDVRVNTVSGSVTTRLEAGFGAEYKINTVSGRIQLDNAEISGVRGSYTGKYGTLDKAWLDFRANTVSGNIAVLHANAETKTASATK
jgi:DUF4097 and DUF4098 domain-containing protein YvlB